MPGPGDIQQGVINTVGLPTVFGFPSVFLHQDFILRGVTRDASGNPLGSCSVQLFMTQNDLPITEQMSDPVTGAFAFYVQPLLSYYLVAYKPGSPDVAGTTLNTLTGV